MDNIPSTCPKPSLFCHQGMIDAAASRLDQEFTKVSKPRWDPICQWKTLQATLALVRLTSSSTVDDIYCHKLNPTAVRSTDSVGASRPITPSLLLPPIVLPSRHTGPIAGTRFGLAAPEMHRQNWSTSIRLHNPSQPLAAVKSMARL